MIGSLSVLYDSSGLGIEEVKMKSQSVWFTTRDGEDGLEEALRPPLSSQDQRSVSVLRVSASEFITGKRGEKLGDLCFKNSIYQIKISPWTFVY